MKDHGFLDPDEMASFVQWYTIYPRHEARMNAEKAWSHLSQEQRLDCIARTPEWLQTHPVRSSQYWPYPATYLNQKRWLDGKEQHETNAEGFTKVWRTYYMPGLLARVPGSQWHSWSDHPDWPEYEQAVKDGTTTDTFTEWFERRGNG